MSYHPSRLSQFAREKIIQAQTPVHPSTEHELMTLREIMRKEKRWLVYYVKRGNTKAAERTKNFLNDKRVRVHELIHELFIAPNSESVTN